MRGKVAFAITLSNMGSAEQKRNQAPSYALEEPDAAAHFTEESARQMEGMSGRSGYLRLSSAM